MAGKRGVRGWCVRLACRRRVPDAGLKDARGEGRGMHAGRAGGVVAGKRGQVAVRGWPVLRWWGVMGDGVRFAGLIRGGGKRSDGWSVAVKNDRRRSAAGYG